MSDRTSDRPAGGVAVFDWDGGRHLCVFFEKARNIRYSSGLAEPP